MPRYRVKIEDEEEDINFKTVCNSHMKVTCKKNCKQIVSYSNCVFFRIYKTLRISKTKRFRKQNQQNQRDFVANEMQFRDRILALPRPQTHSWNVSWQELQIPSSHRESLESLGNLLLIAEGFGVKSSKTCRFQKKGFGKHRFRKKNRFLRARSKLPFKHTDAAATGSSVLLFADKTAVRSTAPVVAGLFT